MNRIALALAGVLSTMAAAQQRVAAQDLPVSYDTFMSLDFNERLARFEQITPANRADLLREQLARWRHMRADSLNAEQHQLLDDINAFISPALFDATRRSNAEIQRFMDLQRRISGLFTPDDSREAFTLNGRYLRPQ
jgi:predicted nucleotidyltransferase component of viral defense system